MKFIRQRKKNLILAGLVGACIIGLPLLAAVLFTGIRLKNSDRELAKCREELEGLKTTTAYVLAEPVPEGQELKAKDLKEIYLQVDDKTYYDTAEIKEILGKRCKIGLQKGTVLQPGLLYEGKEQTKDMRIQTFSYIQMPPGLKAQDLIDIRIAFPDGEDYVVASHKKILTVDSPTTDDRTIRESRMNFQVDEDEILRLASAYVDQCIYDGTRLYAIRYLGDYQEEAKVNYPVNPEVFELMDWDPNLVYRAEIINEPGRRDTLDKNLEKYQNGTLAELPDEITAAGEPDTEPMTEDETDGFNHDMSDETDQEPSFFPE